MENFFKGLTFNLSLDSQAEHGSNFFEWFFSFIVSVACWTYIIYELTVNYQIKQDIPLTENIKSSALFAGGLIVLLSFITSIFIGNRVGSFGFSFVLSTQASLVIGAIALISLLFRNRLMGYFPEHSFVIGAFLTIIAHIRLIGGASRFGTLLALLLYPLLFSFAAYLWMNLTI